jgi:hypothetical protein
MNMEKKSIFGDETVGQVLECAPRRMLDDISCIGGIISHGKVTFQFRGQELQEYVYLYIKTLIEAGGIVIAADGPEERDQVWMPVARYGMTPEDIARNIVAEWVAQGEPDIDAFVGIAFTMPDYIDSDDNSKAWHRANPPKL